ncbi:hypothetical protein LCGC14_2292570 [marine sediment metagenome]|uniref:Polymerase/histidinol phosphatase N-terminal domain-containing protein n=1 Tax=marine sediment metagenome TaxID=412755 RepID=A0A0F9CRD1_9ZZZZ
MKNCDKYKEFLITGEWHVHTNYTDGKNSIHEICRKAIEVNIPLICFTEHVSKESSYDYNKFIYDIKEARNKFDQLIIISGNETKILPSGELNITKPILRNAEYIGVAFHSFPNDINLFYESLIKVFNNYAIDTWMHPGLFFKKINEIIPDSLLKSIFEIMREKRIMLEINKKYDLPPKKWIDKARIYGVNFVRGGDIHSIENLKPYNEFTKFRFLI